MFQPFRKYRRSINEGGKKQTPKVNSDQKEFCSGTKEFDSDRKEVDSKNEVIVERARLGCNGMHRSDKSMISRVKKFIFGRNEAPIIEAVDATQLDSSSSKTKLSDLVFVNPKNPKVIEIEQEVKKFIQDLLKFMHMKNKLLDFNVIECGSFYESLRIGKPYEFDYMIEWRTFKANGIIVDDRLKSINSKDKLGYLKVDIVCTETQPSRTNNSGLYNQTKNEMLNIIREYIRIIKWSKRSFQLLELSDHYNTPNLKIFAKYNDLGIMIDLVPCLSFPASSVDVLPPISDIAVDFYHSLPINEQERRSDVEKHIMSELYLVNCNIDGKWRISTSLVEKKLMMFIPEPLKQRLRLIKFLFNNFMFNNQCYGSKNKYNALELYGYQAFIPSFALKMLFLNWIIEVYQEENGLWQNSNHLEEKVSEHIINTLYNIKDSFQKPWLVNSFLFGEKHQHRFMFGNDLQEDNITNYLSSLNHIQNLLQNHSKQLQFCDKLILLNYPPKIQAIPVMMKLR